MPLAEIDDYLARSSGRFEDELKQFLRIPSISAKSEHAADVRRAADFVAGQLRGLGLAVEVVPTAGHPIVYAESAQVEGAPTLLVYGHYDVQPPEPLDRWITPPFEPSVRDGNIYARGATDDKGQMFTHVKGVESWVRTAGRLPVMVKFLIEGEEEVGSEHLHGFVEANRYRLACDYVVISDTAQFGPGVPAITYGLKGIAYFEVIVTGPAGDLHSGSFGGTIENPANAICRLMAALRDDHGRVQVPGFYDAVRPLSDRERQEFARLPFDEAAYLGQLGVAAAGGEAGYTTLERRWARPTCDVNGLSSGYQGEGAKTIIPSRASAKVSFRLVPDQDPARIAQSFRAMIERLCPPGLRLEIREYHSSPGVVVPIDAPGIRAAERAIAAGFGRRPVLIREGGSIPVVTSFVTALGAEVLLLGFGLPDDNPHAPNEKLNLADFHRGITTSAHLLAELAAPKASEANWGTSAPQGRLESGARQGIP